MSTIYHIVYCTTCIVTKKWYIGVHSTDNLNDGYLGSGKILKRSVEKYGIDNHIKRILFQCNSAEEAYSLEATMVNKNVLHLERCMNLVTGGIGGNKIDYSDPNNNWIRENAKQRRAELNKTDLTLRQNNSKRMKNKNPMSNLESKQKSINALEKFRQNNDHPLLGTTRPENTRKQIGDTRRERNIKPWNIGIKLEKNALCDVCNKYFSNQGLKRHKKVCI
jgi:hypothetical protein